MLWIQIRIQDFRSMRIRIYGIGKICANYLPFSHFWYLNTKGAKKCCRVWTVSRKLAKSSKLNSKYLYTNSNTFPYALFRIRKYFLRMDHLFTDPAGSGSGSYLLTVENIMYDNIKSSLFILHYTKS
jgi:hypothetical protein